MAAQLFIPFHTVDGSLGWEPDHANLSLDSDDNLLKYRGADLTVRQVVTNSDTQTLSGKTLASPVLVTPVWSEPTEDVTATNVIVALESGTTYFLNSVTEFVSTLPAVSAGLHFRFIVKAAPSGANYTVVTDGSANIMVGVGVSGDMDAAGDVDAEASGGDTLSFVSAKAVVGDWAEFSSDGTSWYVRWGSKAFDAITITTAS